MSSTTPEAGAAVLSLSGASKRFGTVQALDDVSFSCRPGEIHAVLGENGSGKSTLLGIASGSLVPDRGTVEIAGQRLHTGNAAEARELGLGMAYQVYAQVLDLSVAENLYLALPASDRPSFRRMDAEAADWLGGFGLQQVNPATKMGSLSLSERQLVEVAKALLSRPKVLLLDEPTTALGPDEVVRLHELVVERAAAGVGVVYVSHRLPEVLDIANRITVLRDGRSQGTHEASEMSEDALVSLMIGRPLQLAFPAREGREEGEVLLSISGFRGRRVGPLDLEVRAGEILGVAGAEGNGQDSLLRGLAGVERASGTVRLGEKRVNLRSPASALRAGIVLLSGERITEALFPVLGVRVNSTVQVLRRFSRAGLIRGRRERASVSTIVRELKVRTPSIEQPVRFLSGGNQQKVALTRPFLRDVKVILADEPTQGVDVRSRFDIYEALRAKIDQGVAMIVKSSDPLELAGLCDRVVVISRGQIVDEIQADDLNERRITESIVRSGGNRASGPAGEPDGAAT